MKEIFMRSFILLSTSNQVPEGRVFALDTQTFIGVVIMIGNIIVLFAVLGFLLYKPVKKILADRKNAIEGQFKEASQREEKAKDLISEYETKLSNIEQERKQLLEIAKKEAEEEKRRIIESAEKEAKKIKDDAIKSLETERQLLKRNTKDYVIELSTLLAEKTLKDSINLNKQEEKFEEGMKELEEASW